jgi:uncharacterized cupredoxin-like copper-binding protein
MLRGYNRRLIVGLALAAVVAAAGSTVGMAAASGAFAAAPAATGSASNCGVPPLPGRVIDVTLTDMGAWMSDSASGAGWMRGGMIGAPMMSGTGAGGMMRVLVTLDAVTVGTVSLRVRNTGAMTHELVVLPLSDGQVLGERRVGGDGRVDEAGSLGEVSRSCGADTGDGLAPGSTGWTTVQLPVGRYELICNLPGHYAMGMHALLTVQ